MIGPLTAPGGAQHGSAAAHALPAWVYAHPGLEPLEIERILATCWQIVCHLNSVPRAGAYLVFDLAGESIIVLRGRDGELRAFHNTCRHRGARLLDGSGNCPGQLTCPYHGWSYRQDGRLVGVPMRESFADLDRRSHDLRPVKVDIAFGFVFVCLRGEPPPVERVWGPLAAELAPYRTSDMVPLGPITQEVWPVDWKLAMDNYLESYHVPVGHPGLNRMFTPDYDDQATVPGVARGLSWLKEQESSRWSERLYQRLVGRAATHLPESLRRCWRFYSFLPNLGIDVFPEQMDFFQVLPAGPGKCVIRSGLFGLPDDRREMRVLRYLGGRINNAVNDEDRRLCTRVQRGLASSSYEPGPLSGVERSMFEFHELLRARIPEISASRPPRHFARAGE